MGWRFVRPRARGNRSIVGDPRRESFRPFAPSVLQSAVPMVLNTSSNENEPVVCTTAEALDCFLRTKLDVLVMGDWVVRRG